MLMCIVDAGHGHPALEIDDLGVLVRGRHDLGIAAGCENGVAVNRDRFDPGNGGVSREYMPMVKDHVRALRLRGEDTEMDTRIADDMQYTWANHVETPFGLSPGAAG